MARPLPALLAPRTPASSQRLHLIGAFAAVYIIWGSTYLAIRFSVATMPPFLMAGVRFLLAGIALYTWTRLRGTARPTRANWLAAAVVGILLLGGGNGIVVWAEQVVPSSLAALLISTTPIWIALIDWLRPGGMRPSLAVIAGLVLGFAGVALLIGPSIFTSGAGAGLAVAAVVPLASLSWAAGSVYSRGARMPASPLLGTGMEMLAGGVVLTLVGVLVGEPQHLHLEGITTKSWLAFLYLIVFGSLVAFTAYVWLLRATTTARAATYAYVNPVVAVFLGWAFAHEALELRTLVAAAIIILAVVVITTFRPHAAPAPDAAVATTPESTTATRQQDAARDQQNPCMPSIRPSA